MPNYASGVNSKGVTFQWGEAQNDALISGSEGSTQLVSPNVMAHPHVGRPYKLYTDACDYAIGAILCQVDDDGVERVIQYVSHQWNPIQRRWAVIEKEAYALVYALQKLRPYLLGGEGQRWAVLLTEYGAMVQYRQGKNNKHADMLSRIESDNAPSPVPIAILTDVMAEPTDEPKSRQGGGGGGWVATRYGLQPREIRRLQHEEYPSEIEEALPDEDSDYTLNERVLRSERLPYQGAEEKQRVVLPKSMREQVVRLAHECGGHMGTTKTLKRIIEYFVWKGQDVMCVSTSACVPSVKLTMTNQLVLP